MLFFIILFYYKFIDVLNSSLTVHTIVSFIFIGGRAWGGDERNVPIILIFQCILFNIYKLFQKLFINALVKWHYFLH